MAAEPKTRPTDASVDDFLAAAEPARRRAEGVIVRDMLQDITGEAPVMWGPSIVGYGSYRSPTGDWPIIGFSPRKGALTLYIMPGFETQTALMARLGPHTNSVSCLYIKRLDQIDLGALRELCEWSVAEMRRLYPA